MGASTSREAAWGPLLASWAGGESIGAGGLGKNSGRAGPVAEGRLAGGERRCGGGTVAPVGLETAWARSVEGAAYRGGPGHPIILARKSKPGPGKRKI